MVKMVTKKLQTRYLYYPCKHSTATEHTSCPEYHHSNSVVPLRSNLMFVRRQLALRENLLPLPLHRVRVRPT